jgi:hypothetical protein
MYIFIVHWKYMIKLFRRKLPHCDYLFSRYLAPWYPDEYARSKTRPDMYVIPGYKGQPIDLQSLQYLPKERLQTEKDQIKQMEIAALEDYQSIFPSTALTVDLLDAVDQFYDRQRIANLIKSSDPKDFSNDYLVSVGQFGVLLGKLFEGIEGFGWLYSQPYFNSIIVHTPTGFGITVFDWAVKKFSEYGVDDRFAAKLQAAAEGVWRKE